MNLIKAFYKSVIDHTDNMDLYGRRVYGLHPTDEMIDGYIQSVHMVYAEENNRIVGAAAVTPFQGDDYHPVPWKTEAKDDEVSVIHLLCTDPERQRK